MDSREQPLTLTPDFPGLFAELRRAAPTWFSARVRIAPPDRFVLDTDAGEPVFTGTAASWRDYAEDAAVRALAESARPAWLRSLLAAAPVELAVAAALHAAGLPETAVRISTDVGPGWHVVRAGGRWVAALDGSQVGAPVEHVRDAAALAVGRVVLERVGAPTAPRPVETVRAAGPFEPLPGEPPLSLFRGVRGVTLPTGTEVDRLGGPEGNVVWVARTPLALRSLPAEFAGRPYSAYVLRRPVEVLTGEAVPWFGQPGGGTAFVLPVPVTQLVADAALELLG